MDKKNSFLMYIDSWDSIEELDTEQRGLLLTAIYAVVLGKELPEMDKETRIAFKMIRNQLVRDKTKYEETIEKRSKAGKKGAEKRWGQNNSKTVENSTPEWQTIAKMADSDSDSDSDSVSVSDSDSETHHHHDQYLTLGINNNVALSQADFDAIARTYQSPKKLIDKVSIWLEDAKGPVPDHANLVHKFALNDNWPKKPQPDPPPPEPDPERGEFCPAPDEVRKKAKTVLGGLSLVEA